MTETVGSAQIELTATLNRLRTDLRSAERITRGSAREMQQSADRAGRSFNGIARGFRRDIETARGSVRQLNSELGAVGRLATIALAAAGGGAAALAVARLADQYTNLTARLRLVVREGENFEGVQRSLFNLSQSSRAQIADITNLYVRLRQSIAGLGDAEAQNITRTLAQTLTISGASASETAAFLRQISQALASGVLRGDEFNSVMENNARFARLLADQLGVGVGQLRSMAEQGQLTATAIRSAIAGGSGDVAREFASMPLTIAGAFTQLQNALTQYIGQTDSGLGASRRLAQGISALAQNFESLADALTIVGVAFIGSIAGPALERGLRSGIQAVQGQFAAVSAARAVMLAEVVALELRINDAQRQGIFGAASNLRLTNQLTAARARLTAASGGLATANRLLAASFGLVGRGAGALVGALGGPLGVAITAASVAFLLFRSHAEEAAQALQSLEPALQVLANARPAFEGAADAIGETADQTQRVADISEQAAGRTEDLAGAARDAASAANIQADATRALAQAQILQAQATVQQAIADQRREQSSIRRGRLVRAIANQGRFGFGFTDGEEGRLSEIDGTIALLERGLASLRSGLLTPSVGGATAGGGDDPNTLLGGRTPREASNNLRSHADALRENAEATGDFLAAMRDAVSFADGDGVLAIRELMNSPQVFGDASRILDPATRLRSIFQQIAQFRQATGDRGAIFFDQAAIEATREFASGAEDGLAVIRALQDAVAEGLISPALAGQAQEAVRALGGDFVAARQIVAGARTELESVRRELAEIQRLTNAGVFSEIDSEGGEGAAVVALLERMARAAGDAREALLILAGTALPETLSVGEARRRITRAAEEGLTDREDREGRIFRASEIRDVAREGLREAFATGDWQDVARNTLARIFENAANRAADILFDVLSQIGSGSGGGIGGFFSSIGSFFTGGGKAGGGPVYAGKSYKANEAGQEAFVPTLPGQIFTNRALRAALSGGAGAPHLVQNINIDARGAGPGVGVEIRAAIAQAKVEAAGMAIQAVAKMNKARSTY